MDSNFFRKERDVKNTCGRVLILGGGRGAMQAVDILRSSGKPLTIAGILDDRFQTLGSEVDGIQVLGPLSDASRFQDCSFVWGLGNPERPWLRLELAARLSLDRQRFVSLIHAQTTISEKACLSEGITLNAGSRIANGVRIHPYAGIGYACVLEHEVEIGAGTLLASGVLLAGNVRIGSACYVGQGANIKGGVRVGNGAFIGMGAVVLEDVEEGETVAGVPARVLRTQPVPDQLALWLRALDANPEASA